jgi:leader peptidase (prepilin peptidase)/N-methyltransferase
MIVTFVDIDTKEVPDRFHIIILIFALCALAFTLRLDYSEWLLHIIGFFAVSVPMLLITLITKGFGGADIKLMAVCGLYLGTLGIAFAFFTAVLSASIYSVYLLTTKKGTRKTAFAFCPFLCFGVLLSLYFGEAIMGWYLGLFGLSLI